MRLLGCHALLSLLLLALAPATVHSFSSSNSNMEEDGAPEGEDPCADVCPVGCDTAADATKPACSACVSCQASEASPAVDEGDATGTATATGSGTGSGNAIKWAGEGCGDCCFANTVCEAGQPACDAGCEKYEQHDPCDEYSCCHKGDPPSFCYSFKLLPCASFCYADGGTSEGVPPADITDESSLEYKCDDGSDANLHLDPPLPPCTGKYAGMDPFSCAQCDPAGGAEGLEGWDASDPLCVRCGYPDPSLPTPTSPPTPPPSPVSPYVQISACPSSVQHSLGIHECWADDMHALLATYNNTKSPAACCEQCSITEDCKFWSSFYPPTKQPPLDATDLSFADMWTSAGQPAPGTATTQANLSYTCKLYSATNFASDRQTTYYCMAGELDLVVGV